jgi:superfamily II DNA or RNA helicase
MVGVSPVTISRWENGQNEPGELAMARIRAIAEEHALRQARAPRLATTPIGMDFGGDPEAVAAVAEASRLTFGHIANPAFATEISLIDPLPHQRVAVYDHILQTWPIRFLLADDAGAGKTIMAGLTVRELLSRRLIRRVLVAAPAGLLGNWQREMRTLFRLRTRIIRGSEAARGNPFMGTAADFAIASIDTLRSKNTFARLREAGLAGQGYDLVIFDEAHKLSADRDPTDMTVRKTARYRMAEALAGIVSDDSEFDLGWAPQSLMMLTATPHMGKPYPYFALWRLLEPDAISTPEALDAFPADRRTRHFIRRTKEEMVKLDGTPLYPQRICDTLGFDLTDEEQELYDETSRYIRDAYNKATTLNRSAARLAMSVFQRRLVSSTYALKRSFDRRIDKLTAAIKQLEEGGEAAFRKAQRDLDGRAAAGELDLLNTTTADEDLTDDAEAHEAAEADTLGAMITENLADLIMERDRVIRLREMAQTLLDSGRESKFARLLEAMTDPSFAQEKMLVFTEHRDTANYLTDKLEALGFTGRVAQLHGKMYYVERDRQVEFFRRPEEAAGAKYLIGTDAAGEGVNLQFCWLMVNYDIPWNPARLEQRMGRIHRYGQTKDTVYIANLVAPKTREGRVLKTLLDKLETIRKDLGSDKVYDVVGRLMEGVSLKSYFDASLRGEDAARQLEGVLTTEQVRALASKERAIYGTGGEVKSHLPVLREDLERERYLRLMPGYVQRLVTRATPLLGLGIEGDVSASFRFHSIRAGAMDAIAAEMETYPLAARKTLTVRRPTLGEDIIWLHPGEPVFDALAGAIQHDFGSQALRGGVFIDPHAHEAHLFHLASVSVERHTETATDTLDCRLIGVRQFSDGTVEECPVEYLMLLRGMRDARPGAYPAGRDCVRLTQVAYAWLTETYGAKLVANMQAASRADLPERIELVKAGFNRQEAELIRARSRLRQAVQDGRKQAQLQFDGIKARHAALSKLREARLAAIQAEPNAIAIGQARFISHALIVPSTDPEDIKRFDAQVEAVAIRLSAAHEESASARVRDVSTAMRARAAGLSDWPGFDLLSERPNEPPRCIEVKGRADTGEVFMTDNEWAKAANLRERYWLFVALDCATPAPRLLRVRDPFTRLIGRAKGGLTLKVGDILAMAETE